MQVQVHLLLLHQLLAVQAAAVQVVQVVMEEPEAVVLMEIQPTLLPEEEAADGSAMEPMVQKEHILAEEDLTHWMEEPAEPTAAAALEPMADTAAAAEAEATVEQQAAAAAITAAAEQTSGRVPNGVQAAAQAPMTEEQPYWQMPELEQPMVQ
jgi:hypothetical protein